MNRAKMADKAHGGLRSGHSTTQACAQPSQPRALQAAYSAMAPAVATLRLPTSPRIGSVSSRSQVSRTRRPKRHVEVSLVQRRDIGSNIEAHQPDILLF